MYQRMSFNKIKIQATLTVKRNYDQEISISGGTYIFKQFPETTIAYLDFTSTNEPGKISYDTEWYKNSSNKYEYTAKPTISMVDLYPDFNKCKFFALGGRLSVSELCNYHYNQNGYFRFEKNNDNYSLNFHKYTAGTSGGVDNKNAKLATSYDKQITNTNQFYKYYFKVFTK